MTMAFPQELALMSSITRRKRMLRMMRHMTVSISDTAKRGEYEYETCRAKDGCESERYFDKAEAKELAKYFADAGLRTAIRETRDAFNETRWYVKVSWEPEKK